MSGGIDVAATAGRVTNKLTDRKVKAFVSKARSGAATAKKMSDGGGLYVTLTSAGTPVWRLKYRLNGKERLYAIGVYPEVSLEEARAARESVKAHLREGRDPLK